MAEKNKKTMMNINEIHLNPKNLRKHNERSIESKVEALRTFGQQQPIVIDGNNIVLAGNGRLLAAQKLNWKEIWVTVSDLKGSSAIAYAIADNRTSEFSEWEYEDLGKAIKDLLNEGFDTKSISFEEFEFQPLLDYSVTSPIATTFDTTMSFSDNDFVDKPKPKKKKTFDTPPQIIPETSSLQEKREAINNANVTNNSTTILVTVSQQAVINRAVNLIRMLRQDDSLTIGECLEIICERYASDNE